MVNATCKGDLYKRLPEYSLKGGHWWNHWNFSGGDDVWMKRSSPGEGAWGKRHRTWKSLACFGGAVSHCLWLERLETRLQGKVQNLWCLLGSLGFVLVMIGSHWRFLSGEKPSPLRLSSDISIGLLGCGLCSDGIYWEKHITSKICLPQSAYLESNCEETSENPELRDFYKIIVVKTDSMRSTLLTDF